MQDDVHAMDGAGGKRSAVFSSFCLQVRVEGVDVGGREVCHRNRAEVRLRVMLDDACRLAGLPEMVGSRRGQIGVLTR